MVVVLDASYGQKKLSTQENYIPSPNAPRPHKQTMPPTTNTRNGPVAPQYRIPTSNNPKLCLQLCRPRPPPPATIPIAPCEPDYHSVLVLPTGAPTHPVPHNYPYYLR